MGRKVCVANTEGNKVKRTECATQGKRAISVRRGGKSAEMKAAGYSTQGNGPKSVRREHESRQLPFSPELRMAAREEGFTEYFVNLVV